MTGTLDDLATVTRLEKTAKGIKVVYQNGAGETSMPWSNLDGYWVLVKIQQKKKFI